MSIPPSSVADDGAQLDLAIWATAAMPAVRQLARPASTSSTGVAPLSSDAKISGWSASKVNLVLCFCSSPSP